MTWNEKLHPRDEDGQFTESWAGRIVGAIGGRHTFEPGRDIRGDLDWAAVMERNTGQGPYGRAQNPRGILREIYDAQGYHQEPHVVDRQELDRLVAHEGYRELFRGVGSSFLGVSGGVGADRLTQRSPEETAAAYATDPLHYIGEGFYGNGTYTVTDPQSAADYGAAVIRMALHPDAKIWHIDRDIPVDPEKERDLFSAMVDVSNRAAIMGYDAIHVPVKGRIRGGDQGDYYVILNRGAVAVQER